jgi:hypothetical protein
MTEADQSLKAPKKCLPGGRPHMLRFARNDGGDDST